MRTLLVTVIALAAGFFAGRLTTDGAGRAGRRSGGPGGHGHTDGRTVEIAEAELREVRTRARQATEIEQRNEQLQRDIEALQKRLEPKPGERREDGTIVGGAQWERSFVGVATGFMDSILAGFLAEAKLTPEQERRIREEFDLRTLQALQISADFANGDLDADTAYERMETFYDDTMRLVGTVLDPDQMKVFDKYLGITKNIVKSQVVHTELVGLKKQLGLDSDQTGKIQKVIEQRYKRIQEKMPVPVPNVFFTPIRRDADADIYRETADAIRGLLRPEQRNGFDRIEAAAPQAPFVHRNKLQPKG